MGLTIFLASWQQKSLWFGEKNQAFITNIKEHYTCTYMSYNVYVCTPVSLIPKTYGLVKKSRLNSIYI